MKKTGLLIFLLIFGFALQGSSQVLQDYTGSIAKMGADSWLDPEDRFEVVVDLTQFPQSRIRLQIPGPATVFANENVWFLAKEDSLLSIPIDQLQRMFPEDSLRLLFVADQFRIEELQVQKTLEGSLTKVTLGAAAEPLREGILKSTVNDLFFVGLVITLLLAAVYRLAYPYLFASMTRPLSLINAEDFSQTGSLQKFFSFDIILYLLITNLALGLLFTVGLVLYRGPWVSEWIGFGFWNLFGLWALLALVFFGLMVVKFLLIRIVAYLFDLGKIAFSHFFYLLRLLVIGSGICLLFLFFFFWSTIF